MPLSGVLASPGLIGSAGLTSFALSLTTGTLSLGFSGCLSAAFGSSGGLSIAFGASTFSAGFSTFLSTDIRSNGLTPSFATGPRSEGFSIFRPPTDLRSSGLPGLFLTGIRSLGFSASLSPEFDSHRHF